MTSKKGDSGFGGSAFGGGEGPTGGIDREIAGGRSSIKPVAAIGGGDSVDPKPSYQSEAQGIQTGKKSGRKSAANAAEDRYEMLGFIARNMKQPIILRGVASTLLAMQEPAGADAKPLAVVLASHEGMNPMGVDSDRDKVTDRLAGRCLAVLARLSDEELAGIVAGLS